MNQLQSSRQCQPCTACCDGWVQMNINGADVYPGCPCPHSTGKGCDDYVNRNWLKQFAEQQGRPLLYTEQMLVNGKLQREQQTIAYGPPEFQQEVSAKIAQSRRLWR